jgi:N-acetylglucosaminyldiphosphoundecaprenol N-acetyl-beta-D-mannosaminyltransferase
MHEESRNFWSEHQPDRNWLKDGDTGRVTPETFAAVRSSRYRTHPHLETMAGFADHGGEVVVEVGCGLGIDGSRFVEGGAHYVGIDQSDVPVRAARQTFDLIGLNGTIVQGDAIALPIANTTVDFVYSLGVLHYIPDTARAVEEIHRILRPGGRCLVMLYHRSSLNYYLNIMFLRRLGACLLLLPGAVRLLARLTGKSKETLAGHRELLRRHGLTYLTDRGLFLSNNTDSLGNPLSKVFSRHQARDLFADFDDVETEVCFLNLQELPSLDRLLRPATKEWLARRMGWQLFVRATRPGTRATSSPEVGAPPRLVPGRRILGMRVDATSYQHATSEVLRWGSRGESRYVCVATVNNVIEAYDDPAYQRVMDDADLVTPDGVPLVWALRLLGIAGATRVYGPDLTPMLCEQAAALGVPVGFYGSAPEVLEDLTANLVRRYPGLRVVYAYSPPFRPLTPAEDERVADSINRSGARLLFVGLGAPKQERWMAAHRGRVGAVMLGVGAAFDFLAGRKRQAPAILQRLGLEWLFRLLSEPRRLWRRYLYRNPRFVALFTAQLLRQRVSGSPRPRDR